MEISPSLRKQNITIRKAFSIKNLFAVLFIFSVGLNAYFLHFKKNETATAPAPSSANAAPVTPRAEEAKAASVHGEVSAKPEIKLARAEAARPVEVKRASFSSPEVFDGKEIRSLHLKIENSLNYSACKALPEKDCEVMSAYIGRALTWFLDMKTTMRNGDVLKVIYLPMEGEERFKILKLTYVSGYFNKTYEVNYYKGPGMKYGAYFNNDGAEIAPRIEEIQAPIKDYMEITSLPGDFRAGKVRGHSGTDFKADVGTPIYAAFEGKVLRVNWNFKMNGDCVEIDHPGEGIRTLYLHLSKVLVRPGMTVKQGQQIAESGNTGRSFAPHLHYEIQGRSEKKVIYNPFKSKFHQTYYRTIPGQNKGDYEKTVQVYDSILQKS